MVQLRDFAHSLPAIFGMIAAGAGVIVTALGAFGVHVDQATLIQQAGALGALATLLSKWIDSWNAAKLGVMPVVANPQPGVPPPAVV
jgi:hypothetical protein